jgi:uncharacterized membrane protein AbrB (regulator of aidB expression)
MTDYLFKSLKWFVFVVFFIAGIFCLEQVRIHGINWMILAVGAFGCMYMMSEAWRSLPSVAMFMTIVLVGVLWGVSHYMSDIIYVLTGEFVDWPFYFTWIGVTFVPGIPIMMFVFKKYDG